MRSGFSWYQSAQGWAERLILVYLLFPVSDYEKIFLLLKKIQGTLDTRLIFLQNIIKEAAR